MNSMSPTQQSPGQNQLLAALPADAYGHLQPYLELVPLQLDCVLYESDQQQRYAYFPTTSVVSKLCVAGGGAHSTEIAIVGNCGIVGSAVFMSDSSAPWRAVVQSAGYAYRLNAGALKSAFGEGRDLQRLLLRYTHALITQVTVNAACNLHHTVAQQQCRWLLLTLDRLSSNEMIMTEELVANILGVRRQDVIETAVKLQAAGFIHYDHDRITVPDRAKLEAGACECYAVVRHEYDNLLSYFAGA
jgi:hypothetical protein